MGIIKADASTLKDMELAACLAALLDKHYPSHFWNVDVNSVQGFINVKNFYLSGKWGFRIDMALIYSISQLEKVVVMAGGELLERYGLRRGSLHLGEYDGLKTDFKGDLLFHRG